MADRTARVRSFNRTVTRRVGALEEQYLARGRSLGMSRLLWEIGEAGTDARDLRARLGLDSGYLSRLLRGLESEGLATVAADPGDRRVRAVALTPAGRAEREALDRLSDDVAGSILEPLTESQQQRLAAAMDTVERLFRCGMVEISPTDPSHPDAVYCLSQYLAELNDRFEDGFDPSRSIPADREHLLPPRGLLLCARLDGMPVGCGAVKFRGRRPAEIKRMWVASQARGMGVARRILRHLETAAQSHGARTTRLETNRTLTEAIALYRSTGYVEVPPFSSEPYAHHWLEKRLEGGQHMPAEGEAR